MNFNNERINIHKLYSQSIYPHTIITKIFVYIVKKCTITRLIMLKLNVIRELS